MVLRILISRMLLRFCLKFAIVFFNVFEKLSFSKLNYLC